MKRCNRGRERLRSGCYNSRLHGNEGHQLRAPGKLDGTDEETATECAEKSARRERPKGVLAAENTVDTVNQFRAALPGSERERLGAMLKTALREASKAGCVGARSARDADDAIVARHFALTAETPLDPEKRGVERKKGQADFLE
jgi:hypothetical protein